MDGKATLEVSFGNPQIIPQLLLFLFCLSLYLFIVFYFLRAAILRGEQGRKGPANTGMCLPLALNTSHQCNIKLCKVCLDFFYARSLSESDYTYESARIKASELVHPDVSEAAAKKITSVLHPEGFKPG